MPTEKKSHSIQKKSQKGYITMNSVNFNFKKLLTPAQFHPQHITLSLAPLTFTSRSLSTDLFVDLPTKKYASTVLKKFIANSTHHLLARFNRNYINTEIR
jgi:hypothetical protein